jgi:tRNA pseudouridine55 synthase
MSFLLINKPPGITSHDVVDRVRKVTGEQRVGHAGTLDPFATGLLIVGVGRESTKHLEKFLGMPKTYEATIRIGESSTTLDPEGVIENVSMRDGAPIVIDERTVERAIQGLTGNLQQIPPMHSAIKIGGKKLYELARKGIEIDRPPRAVTVTRFEIVAGFEFTHETAQRTASAAMRLPFSLPVIIDCSSGTYIRALARDLGEALGTKAYLTTLCRSAIGPYQLLNAVTLDDITPENWQGLAKNLVS